MKGTWLVAFALIALCQLAGCSASRQDTFADHYARAQQYARAGNRAGAIAEYREALNAQPTSAEAHNNLGSLLYDIGQTTEAIQEYERALRLNPDLAAARNNLGVALLSSGRTAHAVAQFRQAVELQPSLSDARFNLCLGLEILGQIEEALKQCQLVQKQKPAQPGVADAVDRLQAKSSGK